MANFGLLPPYLSGIPCNSSLLATYSNYRSFNQRFIRITLRYAHQPPILLAELYPNAQHQEITSPAPSGGLIILSDQNYREAFSHHFPIFVRAHTAPTQKAGFRVPKTVLWLIKHSVFKSSFVVKVPPSGSCKPCVS
jgi:hypothetical protein